MSLALCHSLPRDVAVKVSLLLFFVALVLQAAAIGLHSSPDGAGYFTLRGASSARGNALVLVAAHPATYIPVTSALNTAASTVATKLCNPSADPLTYACARFAESFHIVNGLALTSFMTNFAVLVLGTFVLVRLSHSTVGLLFRLTYVAAIPVVLQCAAVGCFFARTVAHARRDTAVAAAVAGAGRLRFSRRPAANLMVAATALLCAGFVVLFVRWVSIICLRARFEEKKEHSKEEVQQMTAAHMVNDDWTRQKQILLSHARSVQVEMAVKKPHQADKGSAAETARNSEPFPPRTHDTLADTRHTAAVHSSDDSGDTDTLHFRATTSSATAQGRGGGAAPPSRGAAGGEGKEVVMSADDMQPYSEADQRDGPTPGR